ncbi:MAG: hypothetical protein ACRYGL_20135 [Janthinobacterium lividum]
MFVLAFIVASLPACAPTLVSQTQQLPTPARPMQRVVVILNDEVYSNLTLHSSGMSYIHDLRDAIKSQFEAQGITVQVVETNSTDLSNGVGRAIAQIRPTHVLRLHVVQMSQMSRSIAPYQAHWMFDVEQEDLDATTSTALQAQGKQVHRFKSIYRARYSVPACVPLVTIPNMQQTCTGKLVAQFMEDTHRVGLSG